MLIFDVMLVPWVRVTTTINKQINIICLVKKLHNNTYNELNSDEQEPISRPLYFQPLWP